MSKLQGLSDADLDKLYYSAKSGGPKGNYREDDDGYGEGYSTADIYTGQMTDFSVGNQSDHDRDQELSKLYSENVYHDYKGGKFSYQQKQEGFQDIFKEKERRRIKYIDDGRYKPPAEEPKAEPAKETVAQPSAPRPEVNVEVEDIRAKPDYNRDFSGWDQSEWNPDRTAAKEKAQAVQNQSGSKVDYSFDGGSYGSKPAMGGSAYGAKPTATDGVAGGSTADAYGNVSAGSMNAEHKAEQLKNSHLGKVKSLM